MSQKAQHVYEFGPYLLDPRQQLLSEGAKKIPLTPKAFQTLLVLVEAQGRVVAKDELLQRVWPDTFVEEATLAQNIFTLRKQLQGDGETAVYIETVPKRGYRFAASVRAHEAATQADVERPAAALPSAGRSRVGSPWAVLVIVAVLAGATYWLWTKSSPAPAPARVMLAVLPVKNLTGDASQEYLADGLTEEIIADLGSLNPQQLGVIARTSSMAYKQSDKTVQEIARELGVAYVLESSLREGAGRVRFTAQLIRTQDQTHVWAQNYDRAMTDVLALQGELASTVAEEIHIGSESQRSSQAASPRAVAAEAYDNYLKGRFFWNKRTGEAMTTAEHYFRQAIKADPKFASAYAGLADCYQVMVNLEQLKAADGFARARTAALKALELDNRLAEAHTSLASIKGDFDWDWQGAQSEYQEALRLNPNYATAHHWYAEFLAGIGRFDEATAEMTKAHELDPLSPVIGVSLGQMYCRAGNCQQGMNQIRKTLDLYHDFGEAHEALADMYAHLGMYDEAMTEFKQEAQPPAAHVVPLFGYAAAKAGRKEQALTFLRELQKREQQHADYYLATIYAALGDKDEAFASLERARQSHEPFMAYFRADYKLESLRSDPRYAELIARMNMPR